MDIPVQYFQSIIAVELAVTGALLYQVRYFERRTDPSGDAGPDPRWRLLIAVVLGATVIGSLDAIAHAGGRATAIFVTIGLAVSVIPILIRVLPPLVVEAHPSGGRTYSAITVVSLVLYGAAVAGLVVVLGR
jgi:hypothetical protein